MHPNMAAMRTALRVLTAITEHHPPISADVEELRQLAPVLGHLPPDELACEVIRMGVKTERKLSTPNVLPFNEVRVRDGYTPSPRWRASSWKLKS